MNGISPEYLQNLVTTNENQYNMRKYKPVIKKKCNSVTYGINSFTYKGAIIWNDLSEDIKHSIDLNCFKKLIKSWNGPKCRCLMCVRMLI